MLLWWVYVCQSKFLSLTDKSPAWTIVLPKVFSIPLKSAFEFSLLEAVIRTISAFTEKSLCSGLSTTLLGSRPKEALTDFMASSTISITRPSIAAKIDGREVYFERLFQNSAKIAR